MAVVTLKVLTPGWMVVGIVTTRVLLMLTSTGGVASGRLGRRCCHRSGQRGRTDEHEARRDGTDLWNPHVYTPITALSAPGRSERPSAFLPCTRPPALPTNDALAVRRSVRQTTLPRGSLLRAAQAVASGVGRVGMVAAMAVLLGAAPLPPVASALARTPPAPRRPLAATIVIPVGGVTSGYSPKIASLERGGILTVVNNDNVAHTVTSEAVGTQGDPVFDLIVPAHATRTLTIPPALGAGAYAFYCTFHPHMRGTLVVTGEPGGDPGAAGVRAGAADPGGAERWQHQDPHAAGSGPGHAARTEDPDVDLRRHLPRADHPTADGVADQGHLRPRAAEDVRGR